MERWPNLFIVGPGKTGTTSLYEYLNLVPDIYMSTVKEPHYFTKIARIKKDSKEPIPDKIKYLKLFENAKNEKIVGEASTAYFASPLVPELIHKVSPNAYIIISLRNPIERTFSGYLMGVCHGRYKLSFHEELENFFKYGRKYDGAPLLFPQDIYHEGVQRYLKIFGKKNVKILIFEEWIKDPKNTVNEIIRFLGLNYKIPQELKLKMYYSHKVPRGSIARNIVTNRYIRKTTANLFSVSTREFFKRFIVKKSTKPKMLEEDRKKLVEFFQEDVRKLENILGRKFPWPEFYT